VFYIFTGVCVICADVSEHSVSSIFIDRVTRSIKMEEIECSETSTDKIQKPGNHSKEYNDNQSVNDVTPAEYSG
jgi:hypothetical protein